MKEKNKQNLSIFDLASHENMIVPVWIIIGFEQRALQDSQTLKEDTFCRLHVTSGQANIGIEKHLGAGILLTYEADDYSQAYHQFEEVFKVLKTMISFNHIYLIMILDLRSLDLMMLVIVYTFSIYDISKFLQLPNQLKWNLNLMELFLMI